MPHSECLDVSERRLRIQTPIIIMFVVLVRGILAVWDAQYKVSGSIGALAEDTKLNGIVSVVYVRGILADRDAP